MLFIFCSFFLLKNIVDKEYLKTSKCRVFLSLINVTCNLRRTCQILVTLTRWYKANKRTFNSSKVSSNNRGNFRSKYHEKWYFTMSLLSLGMRTLVVVGYTQFIFEIVWMVLLANFLCSSKTRAMSWSISFYGGSTIAFDQSQIIEDW